MPPLSRDRSSWLILYLTLLGMTRAVPSVPCCRVGPAITSPFTCHFTTYRRTQSGIGPVTRRQDQFSGPIELPCQGSREQKQAKQLISNGTNRTLNCGAFEEGVAMLSEGCVVRGGNP